MKKLDMLEVWMHPEHVTEEDFRCCTRRDQLMILTIRPEFRKLFLEFHGSFTVREEFELIMNHELAFEDALCKNEFTGRDIQNFIIEGVLRPAEFEKMHYTERLTGSNWSEILSNTDPEGVWKEYCDFSKFDNADWVNLLMFNPEYADLCPFEKFGQDDIDALLREQPDLAERCGIADAVALYLVNEAPYEVDEKDNPFYPPLPAGAPRKPLTVWLKKSFPEMTETDVANYVHRICFHAENRLGIYSRPAAEKKAAEISPGLKELKKLRLTIRRISSGR